MIRHIVVVVCSVAAIEIQFENRLRTASVLKHGKAKRVLAVDKKTATDTPVVLDNPVSATVLADPKLQRSRTRHYRGELVLFLYNVLICRDADSHGFFILRHLIAKSLQRIPRA